MFESVTESLGRAFRKVMGRSKITAENVAEAVGDVRLALLEADVNLDVARGFVERVREKAVGVELIATVDPGQQFVKIVYDEMVALLGGEQSRLNRAVSGPTVIMLCGLQGTGKTTTAGKLAARFQKENKKPLLVAADVQRPAAIEQLKILGQQIDVPVHAQAGGDPVDICRQAVALARLHDYQTVILDTAGRLAVDDTLMAELERIVKVAAPHEILYVCDAMIGQSAVETAREFGARLPVTGAVMTKLDSDARGGAALSLKETSGVPIKFVTTGEKLDALEEFHPDRMASRILGMGDVVSLVEKAQSVVDEKEALKLQEKLAKNTFTLEDFLRQLANVKKMGGIRDVMKLIPGLGGQIPEGEVDDGMFKGFEAIIQSMTPRERRQPEIIDNRRRVRIARGSGRSTKDVADLLKQFAEMRKMMGRMGRLGLFGGGGAGALQALASGRAADMAGGRTLHGSKKAGTKAQQKKKDRKKKKRRK